MDLRNRPIGVFDSGVGGLTVVKEIEKALPGERIVYFGDTARVPYGTKSKATITRFSIENVKFLLKFKVKLIVVACNSASSLALNTLHRRFKLPIIGVIKPGAAKAAKLSGSKKIGIIGTKATIASKVYESRIKKIIPDSTVFSKSCPLFVPLAEEGWLMNRITKHIARTYLAGFKKKNIDTLILGCTHYPLLKKVIKEVAGNEVKLVDSAAETAQEVKDLLTKKRMASSKKRDAEHSFFVSDEPAGFMRTGQRFLGRKIGFVKKV